MFKKTTNPLKKRKKNVSTLDPLQLNHTALNHQPNSKTKLHYTHPRTRSTIVVVVVAPLLYPQTAK